MPRQQDRETAPAEKTAAKKQLTGQIHPQRQVLIEYPAQRGVHRMRGCEVAAEPAIHHDYRALTQFGGVDLIDERIEQRGRRGQVIQRPARLVQPGGIHQSRVG